jgi:hypothetical protein
MNDADPVGRECAAERAIRKREGEPLDAATADVEDREPVLAVPGRELAFARAREREVVTGEEAERTSRSRANP